ncbi:MAG: hypothetical protein ABI910_01590 [Gemmatimonadota bacterium]
MPHRSKRALISLVVVLALTACGTDGPTEAIATNGAIYSVAIGEELALRLQSIGPGQYAAPPTLSSGALRFVDASVVGPSVPAGVTQRFRFEGAARGTSVITFHHSERSADIVDTVVVR